MNIIVIICFLILISAVKINADFNDIQVTETNQDIVIEQETIKLPWSDCTEVHKKFSFSEKQIKKENKINQEYKQFYSKNNKPTNFSMQFVEKDNENVKTEMLIKFFLSVLETNKIVKSPNSTVINFQKRELLFNKELEDKVNYKRKYDDNVFIPSSKSY